MGTGAQGDYWSERVVQEGSSERAAQEGSAEGQAQEGTASSEPSELRNPLGEEGAELPKGDAQLKHIFREEHHIVDTPETRTKILDYTKGDEHFLGTDNEHGHHWFGDETEINQFWVEVRERIVKNAGINPQEIKWNDMTGLRNNPRDIGTWRGGAK